MGDETALGERARRRGGVFTWQDARAAGFTDSQVRTLLRRGSWRRLGQGVFTQARPTGGLGPPTPDAEFRLTAALATTLSPRCVVSHESAGRLHALPTLHGGASSLQLTQPRGDGRTHTDHAGYTVHTAALSASDRTVLDGIPVTTAARTVLDIARGRSLADGLIVVDHALRAGLVTVDTLTDAARRQRGWPGVVAARTAIRHGDARSESPGESAARAFLIRNGVPLPDLQTVITDEHGRFVGRVDFCWPDAKVVAEFDGLSKYTEPAVLRAEKTRQLALERLGWVVVRWTWRDLHGPEGDRTLSLLLAALNRGRPYG